MPEPMFNELLKNGPNYLWDADLGPAGLAPLSPLLNNCRPLKYISKVTETKERKKETLYWCVIMDGKLVDFLDGLLVG